MTSCGFSSLPTQVTTRHTIHGLSFNVLVLGPTGIGKTTLINSLFDLEFTDSADYERSIENVELRIKEFRPRNKTIDMRFTIIETKGFNNQLDKSHSYKSILNYIEAKYDENLKRELEAQESKYNAINDNRVHCCVYMISPVGSGLKAIDIVTMKQLHQRVCLIPVIAKADVLTKQERQIFVEQVRQQLNLNGIEIFSPNNKLHLPFAIAASNDVSDEGGKRHRIRCYPWGRMDIEEHSDFSKLRDLVLRNMLSLIEETNRKHYERYREEATSGDREERELEELQREREREAALRAARRAEIERMKPPVPEKNCKLGRSFS